MHSDDEQTLSDTPPTIITVMNDRSIAMMALYAVESGKRI